MLPPNSPNSSNSPYPSHPQPSAWPYKPAKPLALPRWEGGPYAAVESATPWLKLLVWALGLPHVAGRPPRRFASVQCPAIFADQLAKSFRGQGFRARIGAGLSEQSREVSVWLEKGDK